MKDVAALAGVSLKTVSRVVNNEPSVAPDLAERVHRAVTQLRFQPNHTASTLRRGPGRSATIGLLLEDLANPFSASIYRAVEDVAGTRAVAVLAGSLDEDAQRERDLAAALFGRRVDGLILAPAGHDHRYLHDEQEAGTPLVFVDRPPGLLAADRVLSDNRAGACGGVEHLLRSGHRRIAYLGDAVTISTAQERHGGYCAALQAAGVMPDPTFARHGLRTIAEAQAAVSELLARPDAPTALFAGQNLVTIAAVRAVRAAGKQYTTALVGFDDFLLADLLEPAVTVVAQDPAAMGRAAATILFERIDGDQSLPREEIVATRLIIRGSGEIAPPG